MTYKTITIYRENGWYKADIWKDGITGRYLDTVMADTLQGIKQFITEYRSK